MSMNTKYFHSIVSSVALISFVTFSGAPLALAYVASSSNYRVQMDSVNVGGALSTSTSYSAEDTLGESAVGSSASASYQVKAGYQQMQEVYLSISLSGNVTLLPNIPSLGGGIADGTGSWTVTTDNAAGYSMSIRASSSPALVSGANNFPDYVPAALDPDFVFSTPAASSRFGFTPEGADIVQQYRDNGAACNVGGGDTPAACWSGLSTSPITIAASAVANHPSGSLTSVHFRAESGATNVQAGGSYAATTTLTVVAL